MNVFGEHGFASVENPVFANHLFNDWRIFQNFGIAHDDAPTCPVNAAALPGSHGGSAKRRAMLSSSAPGKLGTRRVTMNGSSASRYASRERLEVQKRV